MSAERSNNHQIVRIVVNLWQRVEDPSTKMVGKIDVNLRNKMPKGCRTSQTTVIQMGKSPQGASQIWELTPLGSLSRRLQNLAQAFNVSGTTKIEGRVASAQNAHENRPAVRKWQESLNGTAEVTTQSRGNFGPDLHIYILTDDHQSP